MKYIVLSQPTQPILANVFQVSKHIKLNMIKEKAVTLGFNKKTPKPPSTPTTQQAHGQPAKAPPQRPKGPNMNLKVVPNHIL
jgi:hypothetical protein